MRTRWAGAFASSNSRSAMCLQLKGGVIPGSRATNVKTQNYRERLSSTTKSDPGCGSHGGRPAIPTYVSFVTMDIRQEELLSARQNLTPLASQCSIRRGLSLCKGCGSEETGLVRRRWSRRSEVVVNHLRLHLRPGSH